MPLPHRGAGHTIPAAGHTTPIAHRHADPLTSAVQTFAALLVLLVAAAPGCSSDPQPEDALEPTVILISLDGFRWDYMDRHETPGLDRIAQQGVRAARLLPVFPTKTFPNHYSAVTGLYAENHGIVSNAMYDAGMDADFSLSDREAIADSRWWQGEPLWVTAEKQGQIAATYFWPGSEAAIQGVRPTYWLKYDGAVPGDDRVDQVLDWLDRPAEERPTFITLYFSDVDGAGHRHGPDAPEVADAVERVDGYVERLLDGLEARAMLDRIHVMVISDHGMTETSPDRVVVLDRYIDPESARIVERSPVLMMYPEPGAEMDTYEALRRDPNLDVYLKEDLPERFHLDHPRTPPLVAIAETGWSIASRERLVNDPESFYGGSHGYDNRAPSMAGLFVAMGPSFRRGAEVNSVEIIQLYELMCGILGLEPAPNDGRPGALHNLLVSTQSSSHHAQH